MRGDLTAVCNQIQLGVSVNERDSVGNTSLHWAAAAGSTDVARVLLEAGADVRLRGVRGNQVRRWLERCSVCVCVCVCVAQGHRAEQIYGVT